MKEFIKGRTWPRALALLALTVAGACCKPPQQALDAFQTSREPEENILDPLLASGHAVVPLVLQQVESPLMPKRSYAIEFLGIGQFREAAPLVSRIAEDAKETDLVRYQALLALWRIDRERARNVASTVEFRGRAKELATLIVAGSAEIPKKQAYVCLCDMWQ